MIQFLRYLKGYVSIKVWGFSPERFMNLCSHHNIFLWEIKNCGEYYTMCISLQGFYLLRGIARKTGTRVVITGRYGLPFFWKRMKKKKIFVAGLILCFLFLFWMEGYIWNVELVGNFYVTEDVFMDFLTENNIKPGMKKRKVDIEALEKQVRNEFDIVTWTSARIDGTKLIIQLKENELTTVEKEEDVGGYHLVAQTDGVIVSMVTRSGIPLVGEGETIKTGDILVEGSIPIYQEDATIKRYEFCRADADILVQREITVTEQIVERYEKRIYTGNQKNRTFFLVNGFEIKFPYPGKEYEKADVLSQQKQVIVLGGLKLPVYVGHESVREYVTEEAIYSKDEIKNKFEEKIQKFIQTLEEKGVQIIEKNVTINKNKSTWTMKVTFTVTQNVGTPKKIDVSSYEESLISLEEEQVQ